MSENLKSDNSGGNYVKLRNVEELSFHSKIITRWFGNNIIAYKKPTSSTIFTDDGRYTLWGCDLEKAFSCILDLSSSALLLGNLLLSSDPLIAPSSEPSSYKQGE